MKPLKLQQSDATKQRMSPLKLEQSDTLNSKKKTKMKPLKQEQSHTTNSNKTENETIKTRTIRYIELLCLVAVGCI
jgi:hypothetical protein